MRLSGLVLIMVFSALLSSGARSDSFTVDEPAHLASGYAFLARGANWTVPQRGHPLLVDAWEAAPVFLGEPDIPLESLAGWKSEKTQFIESFLPYLTRETDRTKVAARTPAILLAILLAAVVYRWGLDVGGPYAGLLALGILVFDPTLLAHGRLATNDVGVTALGTLGLFLIFRWGRASSWSLAAAAGLVLGATMLAKGSGVVWVAAGLGWMVWTGLRRRGSGSAVWPQTLLAGLLAGLVVWAMYGFRVGTVAGGPPFPVPAPRHWEGVLHSAGVAEKAMVYALGQLKAGHVWWYFPLAALVKNPLPLLIALLLGAATVWRERSRFSKLTILGLFAAIYLFVAIVQGVNIGYRHMLPIHPLIYLVAAAGVLWLWRRPWQPGRLGITLLGAWYILGTLSVYPDDLAFFNELAGGPANGWRYLAESNTDWGQAWDTLRAFGDDQGVSFAYSGPQGYAGLAPDGVWSEALPPLQLVTHPFFQPALFPKPGDYVISANTLSGLYLVDPDNYSWFRYRTPDAVIAHTLFYYHVDVSEAPSWLAQCTLPAAPLSQAAVGEGFGELDVRSLSFDCSQSWIYPSGGQIRGVYAMHGDTLRLGTIRERLSLSSAHPLDVFAARHLDGLRMAYRQWNKQAGIPAFAMFEWEGGLPPTPKAADVWAALAQSEPRELAGTPRLEAPIPLDGPATFLGITQYRQGETLEVETWWQITGGPVERPFSLMAHLMDQNGTVVAVADGLGVSPVVMAPGDVLVQRHLFPNPPDGADLWLKTGAYWLDTLERWTVVRGSGADALVVRLSSSP